MPKRRIGGRVVYIPQALWNAAQTAPVTVATGTARQSVTSTQIPDNSVWADATDQEVNILRRSMAQTGNEAGYNRRYQGDPRSTYVQTSKSYLVNNYLRSGDVRNGYITSGAQHWLYTGYNNQDAINTIRSIDAGMKGLTKDFKVERYEGGQTTLQDYGITGTSLNQLRGMSQQQLEDTFLGRSRETPAYLSTSYRMDNTPRDRQYMASPVKIEYALKKGVEAVVTNNTGEHEVLVGRGYSDKVVGVKMNNGQLVLRVEIDPSWQNKKKV